ncbi:Tol-Pal system beta propeller repeat protein TolB [Mariprofundus ferrooxydans]|uniref:Tol-Pal system beta propeller repeat protein TolB n=1 Tax=Mariprofundus ferrooxydans TaxID=314344 RepID=UPI0014317417|nr:Tol-Pal system beta propeller repeat protein TolB [Mariprofundus ferrooxydans]
MRVFAFLLLFLATASHVSAADFDIYQSDYRPLQVALLVEGEADAPGDRTMVRQVVSHDLASSQSFKPIDPMAFLVSPDSAPASVDYGDWRLIGADILAICKLRTVNGVLQADVHVYDPFRGKQLLSLVLEGSKPGLRVLAHRVADQIYQAALGIPGYFTSHVLYVTKHGDLSDLVYMDQDGANRQVVGKNFTLLLSPDWSPDGNEVALNTYVGNHPRLEFFNLRTGSRKAFGEFKGLNSTPEFSPDGRYVAATLSDKNDINIHIYDVKKGTWRAFTHGHAIDTTPTWSPDGKWIAFVSNRSGKPQIYRKSLSGGRAQLVSTSGTYNTSPAWSPTGDRIAMISLKNWSFAVATVKPDGTDIRYLATGKRVESPSWSSNGQMLLYSAEEHGIRRLYRVPSWGGTPEAVTSPAIDASDPAWSRH